MNTSNQSYKELAIPYFKEAFDCIDEVMSQMGIPYYLIGSTAIALELLKKNIKPNRGTKDIDFAIMMISNMNSYQETLKELDKRSFKKVSQTPWTIYSSQYNLAIDLLSFGEIEENYTVNFDERYIDLHVLGFKEVMDEANSVQIEDKIVHIPPLSGMIILKLIAWSDRPEEREDDLGDILKIIQHYYDIKWDEIVEHHYDLFETEPLDRLEVAAEVLGRESKIYLRKSKRLSDRIRQVIDLNLKNISQSSLLKEWAIKLENNVEYAATLLEKYKKGLEYET